MTINNTYTLPTASSSILGGIKVGSGLSIDAGGILSSTYSIPIASPSLLGGIKVGAGLSIDPTGVLSSILPIASSTGLGGIKVGSGLAIDGSGVLSSTWLTSSAANTVLAGPTSGAAAVPTMRPLVSADLPSAPTVSGEVTASDFKPSGVLGASAAARYHAATASGAPATGTWQVGDIVPDQTGKFWMCTVAGTPGTWVQIAGGGGSSTLASDTDVSIASPVGGQVLGYSSALSKWVNQNQAGVAATSNQAQLTSSVVLSSINTYYDILTITIPAGSILLLASASMVPNNSTGGMDGTLYLTDSSNNVLASTTVHFTGQYGLNGALSYVVVNGSGGTYKLRATTNVASLRIDAQAEANPSGNTATTLTAIQLSGNPVGQTAPAVRARNSVDLSTATAATTVLTFDTNDYDQGTPTPQHSTSSNTSRLVCQQAGIYQIVADVSFQNNSGGTDGRVVTIRLNGTTVIAEKIDQQTSANYAEVIAATQYRLSVGDYIEVLAYQGSGSTLAIKALNGSPSLMMARIDSGPGAVQPNTKVQLDYAASTDLANGTAITAATWTDLVPNQTFTVDDAASVVEIMPWGNIRVNPNSAGEIASRIVIDSASTNTVKPLGGDTVASYGNALAGVNPVTITGLSAGSHTIKLQVYSQIAGTIYSRSSTQADIEPVGIRILERKQSVSPPSSTPAPAVRVKNSASQSVGTTMAALHFDTTELDQGTSSPQHSISSNNSRLTCQQAGFYSILGTISWSGVISSEVDISVRLNGTTDIGYFQNAGGLYITIHQVSAMHYLNVGDYVEFYAVNNNALSATNYADASTTFAMVRCDTGSTGAVYVPQVKTSNYTATATDGMLVAGASGLTFTLPAASSYGGKAPFVVKNDNFTGTIIAAAGTDTIDGASTQSLVGAYESISLVADPSSGKWRII